MLETRAERHLPSGEVELLGNFGSPYRVIDADDPARPSMHRGSTVVGVHGRYVVTEETDSQHVLVVRLQPTGARLLFDLPMHEIANRLVALDDLSSALARPLGDHLYEARLAATLRAHGCSAGRASGTKARAPSAGRMGPAAAARHGRLSQHRRTLKRARVQPQALVAQFRHAVGLPPKAVARVLRFNRLLQLVEGAGRIDWAEVAQECGYFDQAILIRDFRALAGSWPAELMRRRAAGLFRD